MTVLEYLEYICDIRGIPRDQRRTRIKRSVEQVGLGDRVGYLIGELSKGYRQRVGLAQAIIHEPAVLILDEPTSGLDPNQIVEIRSVIKSIGESKTVIFSTHILQEVQATCSRVIIIADGKIAADGTPAELSRNASGRSSILVEIGGTRGGGQAPKDLLAYIDGIESVTDIRQPGSGGPYRSETTSLLRVYPKDGVDPRGDIAKVIATASDMELLQLTPERASLEDVFRKLTQSGPTTAASPTERA
jgi:ABC-2 type transport system ATP-binding protein